MDSFEINKLLGGLLGTVFIVFSVGIISDALFASPNPDKPGFIIEASEAPTDASATEAKAETPIANLLVSADPDKGAAIFKKCQACHSGEKGGPNKVGPDLWNIIDRPVGEHEGFSYSSGMRGFSNDGAEKWTYDNLNHFLTSPRKFVKGTAMGFAGLKKEEDRADLIAFLRTLADTPEPLPEPAAAPAAEPAAATGDAPAAEPTKDAAPATEPAPATDAAPAAEPAKDAAPATEPAQ